jgi:SAM-dependent methyltransferase
MAMAMERGPRRWFFDAWALFYDLPWVQRAVYRAPHDAVLRQLRGNDLRAVLDVGCGTGQLAARIRSEIPATWMVGCDFSGGMLRQARARDRGVSWVQGDAGRLPFGDATFDAVVSTEAFHWFPDRRAALEELRRVLRPGGRLLLALVNPRVPLTGPVVHLASRVLGQPFYWPTRAELRRELRAAGFRVVRQEPVFRLPGALLIPPVLTVANAPPRPDAARVRRSATRKSAPGWRRRAR